MRRLLVSLLIDTINDISLTRIYLHGKYIDAAELNGCIVFTPFLIHHCILQTDIIVTIEMLQNLLEQGIGFVGTACAWHTEAQLKDFGIDLFVTDATQFMSTLLHLAIELCDIQTGQTILTTQIGAIGGRCSHTFLVLAHTDRVTPEETDGQATPCVRNCKYQMLVSVCCMRNVMQCHYGLIYIYTTI